MTHGKQAYRALSKLPSAKSDTRQRFFKKIKKTGLAAAARRCAEAAHARRSRCPGSLQQQPYTASPQPALAAAATTAVRALAVVAIARARRRSPRALAVAAITHALAIVAVARARLSSPVRSPAQPKPARSPPSPQPARARRRRRRRCRGSPQHQPYTAPPLPARSPLSQ
ncbi:hypothetical protein PVAP13_1KG495015 [Panicum virgatum]|uniref:Uncharacterized protein n=1 Tax=Panicum virgatum TaxID=38727 RepID=A0A8T0XQC5_PANVG|nr:hypothetical protein PVAP13_1KG495015 [Panicum virgatum]